MRATNGRRCGGTIQKIPSATLPAADQEIEQQHDGQKRAHDEGQAVLGQHAELIRLAEPVAQPLERPLGNVVRVHRGAEQTNRLVADRLAGEVLDHALKIAGDPPAFGQQPLPGERQDQHSHAEQKQEQRDRQRQTRPPCPLGRPVQSRRENVGDDGGQHERQQNQFDEIEKDRQNDRADHDRARFPGVERTGGAGALDRSFLVASLTRQFHE